MGITLFHRIVQQLQYKQEHLEVVRDFLHKLFCWREGKS